MNEFETKLREIKSNRDNELLAIQFAEEAARKTLERNQAQEIINQYRQKERIAEINNFAEKCGLDKKLEAIKTIFPDWGWDKEVPRTDTSGLYGHGRVENGLDYDIETPNRGTRARISVENQVRGSHDEIWFIAQI